jgi:hypothetical protein
MVSDEFFVYKYLTVSPAEHTMPVSRKVDSAGTECPAQLRGILVMDSHNT